MNLHRTVFLVTMVILVGFAASAFAASGSTIQLAAVQMTLRLDDFWTRGRFERRIASLMEQTTAELDPSIPSLVVFPEDVGLMLVVQGMERRLSGVETIQQAIEQATRAHLLPVAWNRLLYRLSWVPALFLYRHQVVAETYFEVFSQAAQQHNVYIVAGTVVLPPYAIADGEVLWRRPVERNVYNTAYLFGPDGSVLGKQNKIHLIDLEQEAALDLSSGSLEDVAVFDTTVGRIGIAICLDSFREDVVERLVSLGADILVQPSANPAPWHREQQVEWLASSHQQTVVEQHFAYAVNPMLNGPLWDIAFYGQSSIITRSGEGPPLGYSLLEPMDGFVRVAHSDREEEVLTVQVPHPSK